ncbi:carbohydrate ABC transporter permease [Ohessyouella blattaphilus]|uniref:Carbohydrate ABC transporter permease n=1 Tax=Ohessyouella blattaphilus TaxID=2949333 RepID=A0ABT1EFU7_9FIRM|nr:carbohydrate ABC transporter permease [Ohessyouella blattaphilus]MCP1109386.1 carbohydrate ABC transporter permease [Ohessyouella blattaphilus]MCR8562780.1 carbohydrate ABC transporter permease [Ohessyouella blattaphilus]
MKDSNKRTNILIYIIMGIGALIMIIPFAWMILTAFKSPTEATSLNPFVVFPKKWRTEAFVDAWSKMDFVKLYINTILMIIGRVICAVVTATMAGYAFGRLNFKGKNFAFSLVLFQMMVPPQIFIIPQYLIVNKLGLLNTTFSLIFPGLVSAFGTFLLRQSFKSLPKDLEEAARLDGCNIGQTFLHIMMPLARSNMVALCIFTAIFAYKDLMWPLVANTEQSSMPLSSALAKLQGQFQANYPQLMASAAISCVLIVVIYLVFQRQFIEGIATSGGKL